MKPRVKILIIAGSDSSGGAGIQADIKTVSALGGYAMTAVTAITAQNTTGVKSIVAIPPKEIVNQIMFTVNDIKPDAVKIGMLHSADVIKNVMNCLKKIKTNKIILDPVMVAKGGAKLINNKAIEVLERQLIKHSFLITPNIPEAEVLSKMKINTPEDMIYAGSILINKGATNVLIKGGHLKSHFVRDVLINKKEIKIFKNRRIQSKNTHGTGCTLSSAITTYLACGKTINKACELGIKYVNQAIGSKINYGKGHGPINHLTSVSLNKEFI
ncbi:MAG: bifunctional hydroxymethylpyrimidine kinase/phosphomethylpyrimidine kinase [Pelagibacteraceae bacterium]|jgi:hydroxymethylpyrimidine/phosphomethylpyrimidine kinase